jgi:orotidine-5'-phosphate decarboxylase
LLGNDSEEEKANTEQHTEQHTDQHPNFDILKGIIAKKSKLCLALDTHHIDWNKLDQLAAKLCMVKIHMEILDPGEFEKIRQWCTHHECMLLLDRKFADIGSISERQLNSVIDKLKPDFATAHCIQGFRSLQVLSEQIPLFIIAEMSSNPNFNMLHSMQAARYAEKLKCGLVSQHRLNETSMHLVPGVSGLPACAPESGAGTGTTYQDFQGQRYRSWSDVDSFADVIVMGRSILSTL